MIMRVYKKEENRNQYYKICRVCDEWHNYQNFAKWFEENYYEIMVPSAEATEAQQLLIEKNLLL